MISSSSYSNALQIIEKEVRYNTVQYSMFCALSLLKIRLRHATQSMEYKGKCLTQRFWVLGETHVNGLDRGSQGLHGGEN